MFLNLILEFRRLLKTVAPVQVSALSECCYKSAFTLQYITSTSHSHSYDKYRVLKNFLVLSLTEGFICPQTSRLCSHKGGVSTSQPADWLQSIAMFMHIYGDG